MPSADQANDKRQGLLLKITEVAVLLGVSRRTLERMIDAGEFPQPVKLNRRTLRFLRGDIDAYLARLIASRTGA